MAARKNRPMVLLVEDDPGTADQIQGMLEPTFGVEQTHDVAAALSSWDRCKPDVVVVDCQIEGDNVDALRAKAWDATAGIVFICRHRELFEHLQAFFDCPSACHPLNRACMMAAIDCALHDTNRLSRHDVQQNSAALPSGV